MAFELTAMLIVFGTPVAIVALVLTYKLLNQMLQSRNGRPVVASPVNTLPPESLEELREKAHEMQRRLKNLEEILGAHKTKGETP